MNRRGFVRAGAAATATALLRSVSRGQDAGPVTPAGPKKYQAKAPTTQPFGAEAFGPSHNTVMRWLGGAGFLINSRGTTLMIDPLLEGFDMKVMIEEPILPRQVPHLDAVLVTHSDTDHWSVQTCKDLAPVCHAYASTQYVSTLMEKEGLPAKGYDIGETLKVGKTTVRLLPADHDWQNSFPQMKLRHFDKKDACGFWIETPDGTIWATGDSGLLPEQLTMPQMDAILFDYSEDAQFHFGLESTVKIANAYPHTPLLLGHWGTVDAPDFAPFNADPQHLIERVQNPKRIQVLAPGQPFRLTRLTRLRRL